MISIRPLYFVFFLFSSILLHSQVVNMNVVVIHPEGKKFTLYVNNEKINSEPQAIVKAMNLSEGWCKLKAEVQENQQIVTDSFNIKPIEKNNNKEITLIFSTHNKNGKSFTHFDFINLGDLSGPAKPIVPELPIYLSKLTENAVFGNLYQIIDNKPLFFKNYDSTLSKCRINLDEKDIQHFSFLISQTNDFSNRIVYTAKTVYNNCYTVNQLSQILNKMEIEMDKLKYARIGYYHLLDKQNAKNLNQIFKFKTMSEEYASFLSGVADENYQKILNCTTPVIDSRFNEIYVSVVKEKYEHDKIIAAKKIVVKNCFSSAQIKKLVDIFTHDREKLELAKSAYNVVTDKENYKSLEESFQFKENKTEFLNFISKQ